MAKKRTDGRYQVSKTINGKPSFTMHGTRHTHATLLIENGANMKAIQERLGHASFQETMDTYSHVTPKMEDDIVERISKIF